MHPVTNYILDTPEPFQSILARLKFVIEDAVPDAQVKIKWGLPFYSLGNRMFCFLNFRKSFVDLGFPNAARMQEPHPALIAGEGRKYLRSLRYRHLEEIDEQILRKILSDISYLLKSQ